MSNLLNNRILAFLKLVRIENLLMIAFTQLVLRYLVLQKVFHQQGAQLKLNDELFYLVILSTVLIAAAGYIINDYFDLRTDSINHPDTVVVGKAIKRRTAIILHLSFTFIGIAMGMYTALKTGHLRFAIFHFVAAFLLWIYSTHLKKQLLIGNVVVSLLTASVAFMPLVYEIGVLQKGTPGFVQEHHYLLFSCLKVTLIFSLFAFITSMAREIIKDIEDYKGDKETGGLTMPIVWGILSSKLTAFFLLIITALLLLFVVYNTIRIQHLFFSINTLYILITLIIPLIVLAVYVLNVNQSSQFKRASLALKLIMLMGLGYGFIFYYT